MKFEYKVYQLKTQFLNIINYCYIIVDNESKSALIVDPAWEINKIVGKLTDMDVHLKGILLTHSHYDHVNLVDPLIKKYNPEVYMSQKEIDCYGFRCRNLNELRDLDKIDMNKTEVTCLLTQGHTAGGVCYMLQDSLFTGDTIFIEGCGMCMGKGASAEQMFESVQRIKNTVSHYISIYPGHSFGIEPGRTLGYLIKENIYFQIDNKRYFVNFRMRKNQPNIFDFK